jgi:hypothetical protein
MAALRWVRGRDAPVWVLLLDDKQGGPSTVDMR